MAGEVTIGIWEKRALIKPVVEGFRKELDMPRIGEAFEYLYDEMKKREQKLHPVFEFVRTRLHRMRAKSVSSFPTRMISVLI